MTKTRTQLVHEALKNLQAVGAGQTPDDEDYDEVNDKVDSLIAQLAADEVCDVDNDEEIPAEWFDALAELLANACSTKFGQQYSHEKRMSFEKMLRRTNSASPSYEVVETDYF